MKNSKGSAPQTRHDSRTVLERILDTQDLHHVVPRLQPDLLHRVIQSCGLEECGELVALATPEQLKRIFDLDLWHPSRPGMDEQFDAERFGLWLEVLAESGDSIAAQKVAGMDADLVIAGLAQHARVFDGAMVTPHKTTDGVEITANREPDHGFACEVGGYRLVAKRTDSWDAIVAILISLDVEHPDYFHRVMRGCRALSNVGRELDGLDDLLAEEHQSMFDLAVDRESRRDEQGYVTPAQARAFLKMSRELQLGSATMPPANPVARAHLESHPDLNDKVEVTSQSVEAAAALVDVLVEAGIIAPPPRALIGGSQDQTREDKNSLQRIRLHMQFVFDRDHTAYARRNEELTYFANTLMSGCAVQGRPLTAQEAMDAAVAVCNLGLENWPPPWSLSKPLPDDFLVHHDLVTVFQVGWTVLYKDVAMYVAQRLIKVLEWLRCDDRDVQAGLGALHMELSTGCRSGMPWRAREAMEVIAILDMPAWAALLGLIAEFPVLHAALGASRKPGVRSVSASAFEFISEKSQITSIREFMQSLPEILRP
jgi:hypothetical protein